jgi:hypothetical protein
MSEDCPASLDMRNETHERPFQDEPDSGERAGRPFPGNGQPVAGVGIRDRTVAGPDGPKLARAQRRLLPTKLYVPLLSAD